ncbi:unnamed protein product, partial [Effrenium voratum]
RHEPARVSDHLVAHSAQRTPCGLEMVQRYCSALDDVCEVEVSHAEPINISHGGRGQCVGPRWCKWCGRMKRHWELRRGAMKEGELLAKEDFVLK